MKKLYVSLIIIISGTIASCSMFSYEGSFAGLVHDFETVKSSSDIKFVKYQSPETVCSGHFPDSSCVVVLNGTQLNECIQKYDKALVYLWALNCQSELCYPISMIQQICRDKGIALFLVAEYYTKEKMEMAHDIDHPILGIDFIHYKTNFTYKYTKRFLRDLLVDKNLKMDKEMRFTRLFYFENGQFSRTLENLDALD